LLSQIKGEFQQQKQLGNILHVNKKLKTMNIVIPVIQEQQKDGLFQVSDDDDDFFDQDSEDLECDIESSHEWRNLIYEWIEMIDENETISLMKKIVKI